MAWQSIAVGIRSRVAASGSSGVRNRSSLLSSLWGSEVVVAAIVARPPGELERKERQLPLDCHRANDDGEPARVRRVERGCAYTRCDRGIHRLYRCGRRHWEAGESGGSAWSRRLVL